MQTELERQKSLCNDFLLLDFLLLDCSAAVQIVYPAE